MEGVGSTTQTNKGWQNHELSDAEQYRRKMLAQEAQIEMYKRNIAELEKEKYALIMRVAELTDTQCCGGKKHKE